MLTVISPAKRLDDAAALPDGLQGTKPAFKAEASELATIARGLTPADLRKLMAISQPLAELNRDRFAGFTKAPLKPAALFFAGDTYAGLEAKTLDPDALIYAQDHLRILSGLYGLLRPLDMIAAYRLEMGSRLANPRGADLYAYWRSTVTPALDKAARKVGAKAVINCASIEYFGAVDARAMKTRVITPTFLDGEDAKIISFFAKKARGAMARYVTEHSLTDPDDLRGFDTGGYVWDAKLSTSDKPVYRRAAQAAA
jgi:hypothetical protein